LRWRRARGAPMRQFLPQRRQRCSVPPGYEEASGDRPTAKKGDSDERGIGGGNLASRVRRSHKVSAPRCVVIGTGRVAGGFLAPLLRAADWETILVGRKQSIIETINEGSGL
jgi:hypothetical protein